MRHTSPRPVQLFFQFIMLNNSFADIDIAQMNQKQFSMRTTPSMISTVIVRVLFNICLIYCVHRLFNCVFLYCRLTDCSSFTCLSSLICVITIHKKDFDLLYPRILVDRKMLTKINLLIYLRIEIINNAHVVLNL